MVVVYSAMSEKKDVHVVYNNQIEQWQVKREGAERATSNHDTKQEAVDAGRDRARQDKVEFVIHNKDGKISDSDSYGGDPNPPKDTKH